MHDIYVQKFKKSVSHYLMLYIECIHIRIYKIYIHSVFLMIPLDSFIIII